MMRRRLCGLLVALFLLAAPAARAAVTLDAVGPSANSGGSGLTSYTFTGATVGTGNLLVVGIGYQGSANTVTGLTCNGSTATQKAHTANGTTQTYLFTLASPAAGAQSCIASLSGFTASINVGSISLAGAGVVTGQSACTGSTAPSCGPYTVPANGASLDLITAASNGWGGKGASQTVWQPQSGTLPGGVTSGSYNLGATSMTFTWSFQFGSQSWADAAIVIAPAVSNTPRMPLLGTG
jgi:hypothetical protein